MLGHLLMGGANGGLAGSDVRVIGVDEHSTVDVTGVSNSKVNDLKLAQVAGVLKTKNGKEIIGIFNNYANLKKGQSIHSSGQLRKFGIHVDDISKELGGLQKIVTPEGYVIPLSIRDGLPRMDMRPPTDEEMDTLHQVFFTSEEAWNPQCLDNEAVYDEDAKDIIDEEYKYEYIPNPEDHEEVFHCYVNQCLLSVNTLSTHTLSSKDIDLPSDPTTPVYEGPKSILPKEPDFQELRPNFGWTNVDRIKATIKHTTQWFRAEDRYPMRRHFKSRFPGANVPRLNETVATDTVFSDTPAHNDGIPGHGGCTCVQVYSGTTSGVSEAFPMGGKDDLPSTIQDFIRKHGAPNALFSDNAKEIQSKIALDIFRFYMMKHKMSEPGQQNQNPMERKIQDFKNMTESIMDHTGTPAEYWLLCLLYVIYLYNHMANIQLGGMTPIEKAHGYKPDISALLNYRWYQKVIYLEHDERSFPSKSRELSGRWMGVNPDVGDVLTYYIMTDDTRQIISRSVIRSALDENNVNIRAEIGTIPSAGGEDGENPREEDSSKAHLTTGAEIKQTSLPAAFDPAEVKLPKFSPQELLGLSFLKEQEDGTMIRAKVTKKIDDLDAKNHKNIKMLIEVGEDGYEELLSYTELSDIIEEQHEDEFKNPERHWVFKDILEHIGPLKPSDPQYNGSTWMVKILWDDGTTSIEPLNTVAKDDPVSCAKYAKEHDLLSTPGWKRFNKIAKRDKVMRRMMKSVQRFNQKRGPVYMFGVQVPKNVKEARELDHINGNTLWGDALKKEMNQLDEYQTFEDLGFGTTTT